jgi:hypothetical protein
MTDTHQSQPTGAKRPKASRSATESPPARVEPTTTLPAVIPHQDDRTDENPWLGFWAYQRDVWERGILFWDALRQRAVNMIAHERAGKLSIGVQSGPPIGAQKGPR